MALSSSPELYINMKNPPRWDDMYTWEEQDDDVKQFFIEEAAKVKNGVTINGTFIPPWLYWHINFFPIFQDMPDGSRIPGISRLRDNEWFFAEMYHRARTEKKGLGMFGTRRFGKALLDDEVVYTAAGPKKMKHILCGDMIYDDSGKLVEVTGVYPQGVVDIYWIKFEDGRSIRCCGEHLWKVKVGKEWKLRNTMSLIHSWRDDFLVPMSKPIEYKRNAWPVNPASLGLAAGLYLSGGEVSFGLTNEEMLNMVQSSLEQKELFIKAFINHTCGIITGRDSFKVVRKNKVMIHFVQQIFWSSGYYCAYDGEDMDMSNMEEGVRIKSIEYYGRYRATCIEVDNQTRLFLTTDYLVTHNTTIMSSVLCMNATMTFGLSHSVVGFSESDLANIGEYSEYALDNVHPFFRINRTKTDWASGVELGTRMSSGKKEVHARISISNINMGKKSSTQKAAGLTPYTAIFDEIGKGPIKKPFAAAIPSYDTPYGWRLTPILAGTGGEVEMSKDAQEILGDPDTYNLINMDWDLLNKRAAKGRTWKERKWGMFVPGQMSNSGVKKEIGLDEYLKKPKDRKLGKIKILATDFEESTKKFNEKRESLIQKDRVAYASEMMFYPFTIDDCFMSSNVNKFPVELAIKHKNDLIEEGRRHGMLCEVYLKDNNELGIRESDKPLAGYPFKGGIIDSPVEIFEMPVSNKFDDYIYVSALDAYKQAKADTASLGSFMVFKRRAGLRDPYAQRLVCSYTARPSSIDQFCRTCEILQKGYGAICLMENADTMYEQYLNRKGDAPASFYLFAGELISNKYVKAGSRQNNRLGWAPTPANQNYLFSVVIDYCWQDFIVGYDEESGLEIKVKGVELIDDVALLDEIIDYNGSNNVDRIITFGHALVLARYYDDNNYVSRSKIEELNEERRKDAYQNPDVYARAFSCVSINPFR